MNNNAIKNKIRQLRWSLNAKVYRFKIWCRNNPEMAAILITTAIGAVGYFGKATIKHVNLRKQENIKVLYCYDRSLGHYWKLRRELTNKEWLEIDKRKRDGEKLADILDSLNVLK